MTLEVFIVKIMYNCCHEKQILSGFPKVGLRIYCCPLFVVFLLLWCLALRMYKEQVAPEGPCWLTLPDPAQSVASTRQAQAPWLTSNWVTWMTNSSDQTPSSQLVMVPWQQVFWSIKFLSQSIPQIVAAAAAAQPTVLRNAINRNIPHGPPDNNPLMLLKVPEPWEGQMESRKHLNKNKLSLFNHILCIPTSLQVKICKWPMIYTNQWVILYVLQTHWFQSDIYADKKTMSDRGNHLNAYLTARPN